MADTTVLFLPGAEKYVYRLYGKDHHPVGHRGPAVAFTVERARNHTMTMVSSYWVIAGELIYSTE